MLSFLKNAAWLPRRDHHHGYPLDLNGAENFTRPYKIDVFPYPWITGLMPAPMLAQNNPFIWEQAARKPFGPNVNHIPIDYSYQVAVPGLVKNGPGA